MPLAVAPLANGQFVVALANSSGGLEWIASAVDALERPDYAPGHLHAKLPDFQRQHYPA